MGGGYTLSTTILHYNFWKRRGSFLGLSECRGFLEVLYSKKKLSYGSLCIENPYMIMKRDGYMLYRRTGPCVPVPLLAMLTNLAINNTILMMIVDYGYLDLWRNSYIAGNLSQYKNLVVFCLDEQSYNVILFIIHHF